MVHVFTDYFHYAVYYSQSHLVIFRQTALKSLMQSLEEGTGVQQMVLECLFGDFELV